jgi:hypothetical protein
MSYPGLTDVWDDAIASGCTCGNCSCYELLLPAKSQVTLLQWVIALPYTNSRPEGDKEQVCWFLVGSSFAWVEFLFCFPFIRFLVQGAIHRSIPTQTSEAKHNAAFSALHSRISQRR